MDSHELITRYVHEVGGHLPRKNRADIQQELQSLLLDALEERAGEEEATLETAVAVLREFGRPEEIAAQYQAQQYLIGPRYYPIYRTVLNIVLSVMTVFHGLLLGLVLWRGAAPDLATAFWGWATDFGGAVLTMLGVVTVSFILVERYLGDELPVSRLASWDPLKLPPVDDPGRVNRGEMVAEIVATAVFTALGLSVVTGDGAFASFLTDAARAQIPWFVGSIGVELLLNVYVLGQGRWQTFTRWLEIGSELFGIYVLIRILGAGPLVTVDFFDSLVQIGLTVGLVITVVTLLFKVVRALFGARVNVVGLWRPSGLA